MHIHIGYDNPDEETNLAIIKTLDLFLGIPSIILDKDTKRRELYGKAGCFRHKKYGVEYRTLSSFWLSSPVLIEWAAINTFNALGSLNGGFKISKEDEEVIENTINTNDTSTAYMLLEKYNINLPTDKLKKDYNYNLVYYHGVSVSTEKATV